MEGGPECHAMTDSSKGGMSSIFPSLTHTSSGSLTHHAFSTKGSITEDTKSGFGNLFGHDLPGFMTDTPEEDLPDIHARSVKSARVERQADYVGKGTDTSDLE